MLAVFFGKKQKTEKKAEVDNADVAIDNLINNIE